MFTARETRSAPMPLADMERATAFFAQFMRDMSGTMASLACVLGDRLGLFKDLGFRGPATSAELADRTGLDERYVREWLHCLASIGYLHLDRDEQRFSLPPEHAMALAFEGSPFSIGGAFQLLTGLFDALGPVAEAFRSGEGVAQECYGPDLYEGMDRISASWLDLLIQQALPTVDGLVSKLQHGVRVADVGCGRGRALIKLAESFPRSRFTGYDAFGSSVENARGAAKQSGVSDRVVFEHADAQHALSGPFALITLFDTLHDLSDPALMLRRIRSALDNDGVLLVLESKSADDASDNAGPAATILYGTSILYCLPTSRASGGPGLGTLGMPQSRLRALCSEAGFGSVREIPIPNPFNALYEVRV